MPAQDETKHRDPEPTPSAAPRRRWWLVLPVVCLLAVGGYASLIRAQSGGSQPSPGARAPRVPVVAVAAQRSDAGIYISGLGSVVPLNTVTVKSRVDGQLMSVLFQEGQTVSRGGLLAQIDPRPFEVQLAEGYLLTVDNQIDPATGTVRLKALFPNKGSELFPRWRTWPIRASRKRYRSCPAWGW